MPVRGLLHPAGGPLLRGEVHGPRGALAGHLLIDTGAHLSAVDRAVAHALELPSHRAAEWRAVGGGENHPHLAPLRRATVALPGDLRHWELDLVEVANLEHTVGGFRVIALLGWDFLEGCRLVLDGPARTFSLELPR